MNNKLQSYANAKSTPVLTHTDNRTYHRMTRRKLRLLGILAAQLVTQTVEELHVRLLRVPRERSNEGL